MKEKSIEQSTAPSTTPTPTHNPVVRERNVAAQQSTAVSAAKVKANRQNALRSTGPRTQRGKQIASENALKHGFFCKELLIRGGDGQESAEEFESLLCDLIAELQPHGRIEYCLVERIAASLWRLRRIARYETAEIRKRTDNAGIELLFDRREQLSELKSEVRIWQTVSPCDVATARQKLLRTSAGVDFMIRVLENAKDCVAKVGYLSEPLEKWVFLYIEHDEDVQVVSCAARKAYGPKTTAKSEMERLVRTELGWMTFDDEDAQRALNNGEQLKQALLGWIDDQLEAYKALLEVLAACEKSEAEVHTATLLVPQADTAEKIMHYEDHLLRQLYQALDELERIQRARASKHAPSPPTVA